MLFRSLKGCEEKEAFSLLDKLTFQEELFSPLKLKMLQRIDLPNFSTWCDTIEKSMNCFDLSKNVR